jgi:hypothetical protein
MPVFIQIFYHPPASWRARRNPAGRRQFLYLANMLLTFKKKCMIPILFFLVILSGGGSPVKEMNFIASTPSNSMVRDFLDISQSDSIDFIRWKLKIKDDEKFEVVCTYGIAKANTNGFVNEQKVEWTGTASINDGVVTLNLKGKTLCMLLLNPNIMHLLYPNGTMMVGNGGWSYTLNSVTPLSATAFNLKAKNIGFTDSIVFDGRTPCRGIEELTDNRTRSECYKKKWRVSLYKDQAAAVSGTYKIGTVGARAGRWKLKEHVTGRPVYSLDLNNGNTLDLLQVDENIVYIMDRQGGLMIGDHDFSYSLNRKDYPGM